MKPTPLLACRQCGQLHQRIQLAADTAASCVRCHATLYRYSALSLNDWTAILLGSLITFAIAYSFPIVVLTLQGTTVNASIPQALWLTWQQGYHLVALMGFLFTVVFPVGQLCFQLWAIRRIYKKNLPSDFRFGLRVLEAIVSWSMIPVLCLAILVALVKLAGMATVHIGPALYAFGVLLVLMTISGRLSANTIWQLAEDQGLVAVAGQNCQDKQAVIDCRSCGYIQPMRTTTRFCRRCGAQVFRFIPDSFSRAWAFVIAAAILYLPANILPVMELRLPTGANSHTILGGVIELWQMGSVELALVVFTASVLVPITKILALGFLLIHNKWRGLRAQRQRTRLYQIIEFVGHWSMLDVFVVLLLTAMADFPGLSQVKAGPGATAFGAVVILTMFAAMSYDARIGWNRQSPSKLETKNEQELTSKLQKPRQAATLNTSLVQEE